MAITEAVKKGIWLRGLFSELMKNNEKDIIFYKSQSANKKITVFCRKRIRHIDIKYHFVLEVLAQGDITARKNSILKSHADIFMKSLTLFEFKYCLDSISINY